MESQCRELLEIARRGALPSGLGRALCLLGDVLQATGRLGEAAEAFEESLEIFERLASSDPANAGWQFELAVAHSRVGAVFEARGQLEEAAAAFRNSLAICQRLVTSNPSGAGWQGSLAAAHARVGEILQTQGQLEQAAWEHRESLTIVSASLLGIRPTRAGNVSSGRATRASATFCRLRDALTRLLRLCARIWPYASASCLGIPPTPAANAS